MFILAGPENAPKVCYKCKKAGHLSRDCPEHPNDNSNNNANGALSNDSRVGFDRINLEVDKVALEEDDIHEIGEEDKGKLNDLDYLTGNPLPSDILLYAVPVCGPYSAVQSYKYRVKIVPGTAKKGKGISFFSNAYIRWPFCLSAVLLHAQKQMLHCGLGSICLFLRSLNLLSSFILNRNLTNLWA